LIIAEDRHQPNLIFFCLSASAFSRVERAVLSAAEPNEAFITFYRIWVRMPAAIPAEACYLGWQESLTLLAKLVEAEIPDQP